MSLGVLQMRIWIQEHAPGVLVGIRPVGQFEEHCKPTGAYVLKRVELSVGTSIYVVSELSGITSPGWSP